MAFDASRKLYQERRDARQAFLESCSPGSTYHECSKLPVTITQYPQGFVVHPALSPEGFLVVPFDQRDPHFWAAIVVRNPDPDSPYPVGCSISITHDEIERGTRVIL